MPYKRRKSLRGEAALTPGKAVTQTVKIDGKRVVVKQRMDKNGIVHTSTSNAAVLESDLQAAQVAALKAHPLYDTHFILAGDMGAGKRGPKAIADALRTGLETGEPDLRLYLDCGRLVLIENKGINTPIKKAQTKRHADLRRLGYDVYLVVADREDDAARRAIEILESYFGVDYE